MFRYGATENPPRKSTNAFTINGGTLFIHTSQGQVIVADSVDTTSLQQHSWCVSKTGYAVSRINGKVVKLHRYLLDPPSELVVDHINGDKLDNRRENLRICPQARNGKNLSVKTTNTSGFPGIRVLPGGRYNARIMVDRKGVHIGNYDTIDQAIAARIKAESEHYGDFAPSIGATRSLVTQISRRGKPPAKQ